MAKFERQETVVLSIEVTDADGTKTNPATTMNITITDPAGTAQANDTEMANDTTGEFHYDFTAGSTGMLGRYDVLYIATDGSRVTRHRDTFVLHK